MSKLIVLTGATRGLGRALVPHFVAAGHTVVGCGRDAKHVAELAKQFPAPHAFTAVDVTDPVAVIQWAKSVGPPDLLINNAALMNTPAPLWEVPADEFLSVLDVNVMGVFYVIKEFVPAMVARKSGVIVNLSSGRGRAAAGKLAPYCASKYAIEGLTKALAQELPAGMAAVPLNPGAIDTDMTRINWGDDAGQFQTADEWAKKAAAFLLALDAKDNGKSLSVG